MEKESIMRRKSYTAMFKLEVVEFTNEKGNCEAARKFNVGETSVREWRKEEAAIKCLYRKKHALRYRRCFWPELEKSLVEWVISERLKGNKVSTTSILIMARRLAEENSCLAHITDNTKRLVSKYSKLAIIPGGFTKKSSRWIFLLINLLNQSCVLLG
jgi:transposase-like protein